MLIAGNVLTHPFIVEEWACGNLNQRTVILESLNAIPRVAQATHEEAMHLLDANGLQGRDWYSKRGVTAGMICAAIIHCHARPAPIDSPLPLIPER